MVKEGLEGITDRQNIKHYKGHEDVDTAYKRRSLILSSFNISKTSLSVSSLSGTIEPSISRFSIHCAGHSWFLYVVDHNGSATDVYVSCDSLSSTLSCCIGIFLKCPTIEQFLHLSPFPGHALSM